MATYSIMSNTNIDTYKRNDKHDDAKPRAGLLRTKMTKTAEKRET